MVIRDGTTILATLKLGQNSAVKLALPSGTHSLTASYLGDGYCAASSYAFYVKVP